jgi:hypothetical protein
VLSDLTADQHRTRPGPASWHESTKYWPRNVKAD